MAEKECERPAKAFAKRRGWTYYKLKFLNANGAPDDWFGRNGESFLIEFKDAGQVASPQQEERHKELREHFGMRVEVVDSIERAYALLT